MSKIVSRTLPDPEARFYPWALAAAARSIAWAAQAQAVHQHVPLVAISAYYALFHGGIWTMLLHPSLMDAKLVGECDKLSGTPERDPAILLKHAVVGDFLSAASAHGLANELPQHFQEAKKLREFLNYGPRMHVAPKDASMHFNTCEFPVEKADTIANYLPRFYKDVLVFTSARRGSRATGVASTVYGVRDFFAGTQPLFGGIFTPDVLRLACSLIDSLEETWRDVLGREGSKA
jgi:hypothetical protein